MSEQRGTLDIGDEINHLDQLIAEHLALCKTYPEDVLLKMCTDQLIYRRDDLEKEYKEAAETEHSSALLVKKGREKSIQ